MHKKLHARKVRALSPRAKSLYARIRAGKFYKAWDEGKTPKAMQELIDAKLVRRGARVVVVGSYFVPHDCQPYKTESWPGKAGL